MEAWSDRPLSSALLRSQGPLPSESFERWLQRGVDEARHRWPDVDTDPTDFMVWLGQRVGTKADARYQATRLRIAELFLAFAHQREDRAARTIVEEHFIVPAGERYRREGRSETTVAAMIARLRALVQEGALGTFPGDSIPLRGWLESLAHEARTPVTSVVVDVDPLDSSWTWFDNRDGEGIVDVGLSLMGARLTVAGQPVFDFGGCGTCSVLFEKVADAETRVDDAEAVTLLGTLDALPSEAVLRRLARPLQPVGFRPVIVEGWPRLVWPGSEDDYFANEVVRVFGDDAVPTETTYYRFEQPQDPVHAHGKVLSTAFVVPLHDPHRLDPARVAHWKAVPSDVPLTAIALAVYDEHEPAVEPPGSDPTVPYTCLELVHFCLLDGHHRVQAAAELNRPVRILAFVLSGETDGLRNLLDRFSIRPTARSRR